MLESRVYNRFGVTAPGELIGNVVDTEPGDTGFESRCGRYIFLVHTYAVTQTVQAPGIMRTEKYNRFTPVKINMLTVNKTFFTLSSNRQ